MCDVPIAVVIIDYSIPELVEKILIVVSEYNDEVVGVALACWAYEAECSSSRN
jgi:hypothetical protein